MREPGEVKRAPWARIPDCHPERKHKAFGLCNACYLKTPAVVARRAELYADWAIGSPKYHPNKHLKTKYGITLEDYERMLEAQGGKCAICGTDKPGGKGRFHVDHDHATNVLRGLLCALCNKGLGIFHDNPDTLRQAAEYLERHGA